MRSIFSLVFILINIASLMLTNSAEAMPKITPKAKSVIKKLDQTSDGIMKIKWNSETDTPSRITGRLSKPSKHSPQWIAYTFISESKALYGLSNPVKDMQIKQIDTVANGSTRVQMQRYLFDLPVLGDVLTIEMDKQGVIVRVEGTIYPDLEKKKFHRPMYPAITETEAIKKALKSLPPHESIHEPPLAELYYLPSRPGIPLVYLITLQKNGVNSWTRHILVHAVMGHIVK